MTGCNKSDSEWNLVYIVDDDFLTCAREIGRVRLPVTMILMVAHTHTRVKEQSMKPFRSENGSVPHFAERK